MIQFIADGLIIPVVVIGALWLWFNVRQPRIEAYKYMVLAGLTSLLTAKLLSMIYHPSSERPFEALGQKAGALYLDNPGFPSDHALFVTVIVVAVWALTRRPRIALLLAILASLICIGRVLALVHTPIDVIGGVLSGLFGGVWYLQMKKHNKNV